MSANYSVLRPRWRTGRISTRQKGFRVNRAVSRDATSRNQQHAECKWVGDKRSKILGKLLNSTELFHTFSRNHLSICRPLITIAISQTNCSNAPLAWRVREQGHGDKAAMKMAAIRAVLTFSAPRAQGERVAAHLSPSPTRKQRTSADRKAPPKIR